jgi:hypothetical protein
MSWSLFGYIVIGLCLSWLIAAMVGRRRRLRRLRELLGLGYSRERTYVRWGAGIAVNERGREFAVVRGKHSGICKAEEIIDVALKPSSNAEFGGQAFSIDTRNENLPNFQVVTVFPSQRISDVAARLRAMQSEVQAEAARDVPRLETVPDNAPDLGRAIATLSDAVTSLAEAIRESGRITTKGRDT